MNMNKASSQWVSLHNLVFKPIFTSISDVQESLKRVGLLNKYHSATKEAYEKDYVIYNVFLEKELWNKEKFLTLFELANTHKRKVLATKLTQVALDQEIPSIKKGPGDVWYFRGKKYISLRNHMKMLSNILREKYLCFLQDAGVLSSVFGPTGESQYISYFYQGEWLWERKTLLRFKDDFLSTQGPKPIRIRTEQKKTKEELKMIYKKKKNEFTPSTCGSVPGRIFVNGKLIRENGKWV